MWDVIVIVFCQDSLAEVQKLRVETHGRRQIFIADTHDTPSRELFDRSSRDFSSGCIRVQDPLELAAWLLRDVQAWTPERIRAVAEGTVETAVTLPAPIPVHLLYWTTWADLDGTIHFREDIYSRDDTVWTALGEDPPGP